MADNRFETIWEIAIRNELPILQVAGTYLGLNFRVYARDLIKGGKFQFYNPFLEEKTYRLTERHIENQKIKELNKSQKK